MSKKFLEGDFGNYWNGQEGTYEKKNWSQQTVGIQEGQSPRNLFVSSTAEKAKKQKKTPRM